MEELFKKIEDAKDKMGQRELLFRGHSSVDYQLLPTLFRNNAHKVERSVFYKYKSHVAAINGVTKSNWDLLLDMQHYGLPTRLLDWTTSVGTALYFALKGNPESPCIWLLDPFTLNGTSTGQNILFDLSTVPDEGGNPDFSAGHIMAGDCKLEIPYAIQPPHGNSRISAQRGLFTVHTTSHDPIEVQCPDSVMKIEIPKEEISKYMSYIKMLGIDDFSLFPDQAGLAAFLKCLYSL